MTELDTFSYVYYSLCIFLAFILFYVAYGFAKKRRKERLAQFSERHPRKDIR
jgi:hypothetical protein